MEALRRFSHLQVIEQRYFPPLLSHLAFSNANCASQVFFFSAEKQEQEVFNAFHPQRF